jgi:hypothetical protein
LSGLEDVNVSEESASFAFRVASSMKMAAVSSPEIQVFAYKIT